MSNILADKLRTFLTCLGMMIGTTALVCLMTTFVLERLEMAQDDKANGYYNINIRWYTESFSQMELDTIRGMEHVAGLSPIINVDQKFRVKYQDMMAKDVNIRGVGADYYDIGQADTMDAGRGICASEVENCSNVCVINRPLAQKLFRDLDPVGKAITFGGINYEVVGVSHRFNDNSNDKTMIMPYNNVRKLFGNGIDNIAVYPESKEVVSELDERVRSYMNQIAKTPESYEDTYNGEWLEMGDKDILIRELIQYAVAIIAMLIGGIGIMNMMLVMVTERTVEIGLRKALGATPVRIQFQFIAEAIIISLMGTSAGILLGAIGSAYICYSQAHSFIMSPLSILLSFVFSLSVGVLFGWIPARNASRLSAIDALKSE